MPAHMKEVSQAPVGQRGEIDGNAHKERRRGLDLLDIHCSACGAPAEYDIVKHTYACAYCALRQRELQSAKLGFAASTCSCSGCGATVVFPEDEVLQSCSFCGRALVRGEYLETAEFPELIIPFCITDAEARGRLQDWCAKNTGKSEAKHLLAHLGDMQGYYLPYKLVRGPIDCAVSREGAARKFDCGGFLEGIFVNTSS